MDDTASRQPPCEITPGLRADGLAPSASAVCRAALSAPALCAASAPALSPGSAVLLPGERVGTVGWQPPHRQLDLTGTDAQAVAISADAPADNSRSLFERFPAAVLIAALVADSGRYADPDLWGHIRFGEFVLRHGRPLLRDPYSYSAPGHLWLNHEWLSELVFAATYDWFGVLGLKLFKFTLAAATIALIARALAQTRASIRSQFLVLTVGAVALGPLIQFRPQLFTFVILAALLALLAEDSYRGQGRLWVAVPLMALWANLHGGFFVGLVLLLIYTGFAAWQGRTSQAGRARAGVLARVSAASLLATLITPYGLGSWYVVARALGNPFTRRFISDWRPLSTIIISQRHAGAGGLIFYACFAAIALGLGLLYFVARRRDDLALCAFAALTTVATLLSVRNMALALIACAPPLAARLSRLGRPFGDPPGAYPDALVLPAERRRWLLHQGLVATAASALALQTGLFSVRLATPAGYPEGAVKFMAAHKLHGNILCDFNWGEYLIWHVAPGSRVFIDGRYDTVYPLAVIRDYLNFYFNRRGAAAVLARYPHDYVLIPPDSKAAMLMGRRADWRVIYRDKTALLFARHDAALGVGAARQSAGDHLSRLFP